MGNDKKCGPKVLVVDDAPFMRGMVKYFLAQGGYEVCGEAGNGRQAIELLQALSPDLVIMDIIMPDMSGVEAVREIRRNGGRVKILMLSAVSNKPVVSLAMDAGATDFLAKPFKRDVFLNKVSEVLRVP